MMPALLSKNSRIRPLRMLLLGILLCFTLTQGFAQEDPPRPVQVTTFQNLSFGAIIQGNVGGKVIIDPQGNRTITGDLYAVNLGYQYYPAIFEIEALPGSIVTLVNGPDVLMNGSNGGTITLHLGASIPASPFINKTSPPFKTQVRIGGELTVGNSLMNPSGDYIGYFQVTFVQQ
jgi:hypothetical protein